MKSELLAVSAGGVLGALARYGLVSAWPDQLWAVWTINVSGSFGIGVLMVLIARRWPARRLLRPFLGVGVLGGYTTFSTAMVDVTQARPAVALLYLVGTVAAALLAVWAGTALTSALVPAR